MNLKHVIYFLALIMISTLAGCSPSSDDKNKNSQEFREAEESLKDQIEEVVYNIPSPSEIPYLLQATGAEFNPQLVNSRAKAGSYLNRQDKAALNLGVYAADIGYLSSHEKTQEAIEYLNACKTLADNLGVVGSFDVNILKRFEANIGNRDSLAYLLNEAVHQTESFLRDNNRNRVAALVIGGSFIEGLYISTGLVRTYPKDILPADARNLVLTPLIRVILEQRKSVSELLKMFESLEQTEPVATIVNDLRTLETNYEALNIEEQIRNNRADLVLTDANLVAITETVAKVRKHITD